MRMRWVTSLGLILLVAIHGCQPASRYSYTPKKPELEARPIDRPTPTPPRPIDPNLIWEMPHWGPGNVRPADIPIVFVAENTDAIRWAALPGYWTPSPLADPRGIAGLLRSPLEVVTTLAITGPTRVEIKVPRGLPDPTANFPAGSPPTLGAWQLGRRLYFDTSYLVDKRILACATCHDPAYGFASHQAFDVDQVLNAPGLLNVAFRQRLFWDGRAETLEACLQCPPEGERTASLASRHTWPGAVERLRYSTSYRLQFRRVFGTDPNQDTVARALAAYLRTLLGGNSLHDRAVAAAKAVGKTEPEVEHFAALLEKDPAALTTLQRADAKPLEVAQDLHRGYLLFHDQVQPTPTACVQCHGGPLFSDRGFHNLSLDEFNDPTHGPGHFATVPAGLRNAGMMGAFHTPSLRDVARTWPYFHSGGASSLASAVQQHLTPRWTTYLDPLFLVPGKPAQPRERNLLKADQEALLLYLHALTSEPLPMLLQTPPR